MHHFDPKNIRSEKVIITPAQAKALLDRNAGNRVPRSGRVECYAKDMREGNWHLTGESIKIAFDGTLLDGQHRLMACVEANVPFETFVIYGLDLESRDFVDTGAKRTFGDLLRWKGEVNAPALAAAIETGYVWDATGNPGARARANSNAEKMKWLADNPDIRDAVRITMGLSNAPLRFRASVAAPFFMRINRIDAISAAEFLNLLKTGADLSSDDPIFLLRKYLLAQATAKYRTPNEHVAAVAVKAWNAWISNRRPRQLSWKRSGANREEFPLMVTAEGNYYEERLTDPISAPATNEQPATATDGGHGSFSEFIAETTSGYEGLTTYEGLDGDDGIAVAS